MFANFLEVRAHSLETVCLNWSLHTDSKVTHVLSPTVLLQATVFETLPFSDSGRGFLAWLGSGLLAEGTCFAQR